MALNLLKLACLGGLALVAAPQGHAQTNGIQCPVLASSDWQAWVDKMPGTDGQRLHVSGRITLPGPGYKLAFETGIADRMAKPTQQVVLTATAPDGMTAQVLETVQISGDIPALASGYTAVMVLCGDTVIARIDKVDAVH